VTEGAAGPADLACTPGATPVIVDAARLAGLRAIGVADASGLLERLSEPSCPFAAVVVDGASGGFADAVLACKALRRTGPPRCPILLLTPLERLDELPVRDDLFDDFATSEARASELAARLRLLTAPRGVRGESLLERGPLVINLTTYQATIAGRALDLTYMEYELLRFLTAHADEVVTRETLLSRVWGYEYYGGARTVDVHVRRLRAKLGEEHAHLIQTVRGVGYRFT